MSELKGIELLDIIDRQKLSALGQTVLDGARRYVASTGASIVSISNNGHYELCVSGGEYMGRHFFIFNGFQGVVQYDWLLSVSNDLLMVAKDQEFLEKIAEAEKALGITAAIPTNKEIGKMNVVIYREAAKHHVDPPCLWLGGASKPGDFEKVVEKLAETYQSMHRYRFTRET
ncbi:hypothetical protein KY363_04520 [Candidatus Woesearchaeota archaeon]|nr:hypothetical protein [Candidatus Woesearchaeota archaeon]